MPTPLIKITVIFAIKLTTLKIRALILFLSLGLACAAQSDTTFYQHVKELQSLFDEASYKGISFEDTSLRVIDGISSMKKDAGLSYRSDYLQKQLLFEQRDYGLSINGGYLENFSPTVGDLEDNVIYHRRFQLGAQWDVLKGGYFESKAQARILEDRIVREQLNQDATTESFNYLKRFDQTIYAFNEVKIYLLELRKSQLERQHKTIENLVFLKMLKKEDLIEIDSRLAEVHSLMNVYKSYNEYLEPTLDTATIHSTFDLSTNNLPLIDLNYDKIFNLLGTQTDSLLGSRAYEDYYSWYHEVSLKPYVRYNFYDLIDNSNRSFFSAGLTFGFPIPFNTKLKNEVEAEKWAYDNQQLVNNRVNLHEEILNIGYEFRYKLKQFISFYQKRKIFVERLRVEKVKVRLNDNNIDPLMGLGLFDDLVQIDIELVDLLQNMYIKALKIHSKLPHTNIREIVNVQTAEDINDYLDKKERSVYVWTSTFEDYSAEFLSEYVIYNEFEKIIVAVSTSDTSSEKRKFMQYAATSGDLYLMLGDNKLFYEENIGNYLRQITTKYKDFDVKGIHLDIEPHTFEEWDTQKEDLRSQYVELVGKASTYCNENGLELSISIPFHYGELAINNLLGLVDQIYFMCYENVKTEYLVRKITTYVDNSKDKIVIALRTEDFDNRIGMEEKIKELFDQTSIHRFAYHDLRRMIEFDRRSIE